MVPAKVIRVRRLEDNELIIVLRGGERDSGEGDNDSDGAEPSDGHTACVKLSHLDPLYLTGRSPTPVRGSDTEEDPALTL